MQHWPPRVANSPPRLDGIYFPALGPKQGHKVQHLLVTLGRLKRIFTSAVTPRVRPVGADFNFCISTNA
jgi:hypothetical protein